MASWNPNLFKTKAKALGCADDYIDNIILDSNILNSKGVYPLLSIGHLANQCEVSTYFLKKIVSRKIDPCRAFSIRKRSGGRRKIFAPYKEMLDIQRWINRNILMNVRVTENASAYARGCSPFKNAEQHCGTKNWIIKVDIQNFFDSIPEKKVYKVFYELGYKELLAFELSRICTRVDPKSAKKIILENLTNIILLNKLVICLRGHQRVQCYQI